MAYYRHRIMSEPSPPEEELEKENKFAGESFGTDNVRTVYAGSSNDTKERESRIIILVGPSGTGKSTLIDCMCNYFYGAKINDPIRYKIADERFDNTTPKKSIIKYVFNGTDMPYRPIVIDTPGIGDPSGVKTDDELKGMIRNWLAFDPRSHIHVVGLVIPASMTRLTPRSEIELQHTLGLFPRWMHANVVPMVTKCDGAPEPSAVILRHFDLHNHRRFRFNTSALYQKPSANHLNEQLRQMYWDLSMSNMEDFFDHVGRVHPQCVEEQLDARVPSGPPTTPPHYAPPPPPKSEAPTKPPRSEIIPSYDLPPVPEVAPEVSIQRYTYDPSTLSHNLHLVAETRTIHTESGSQRNSVALRNATESVGTVRNSYGEPVGTLRSPTEQVVMLGSSQASGTVRNSDGEPIGTLRSPSEPSVTLRNPPEPLRAVQNPPEPAGTLRNSFPEHGTADSGFCEKVLRSLTDDSKPRVRETNLDEGLSSADSSPTDGFRKHPAEFSLRSTASEWQYTPSTDGSAPRRFRPGSGIRRSGDTEHLTPMRRESAPNPPNPAPRDSLRRNGTVQYENVPGNTVPPPVPVHATPVVAPLVRDTDVDGDLDDGTAVFQRNDASRASFRTSSVKNGRRPSVNRPDSANYGDDWGSEAARPVPVESPEIGPGSTEWDAVGYKPNPRLEPPRSLVVASRPYYFADRREPKQEKRLLRDVEAVPASKYQYSPIPPLLSPAEPKAPANTPCTPTRRGAAFLAPKYLWCALVPMVVSAAILAVLVLLLLIL